MLANALLPNPDGWVLLAGALFAVALCIAAFAVWLRDRRRTGRCMGAPTTSIFPPKALKQHPRAFYLLALVQFWERFACFAMLPLLVLYLEQHYGVRTQDALLLFGIFQALSYLSGLPGGFLSDRWLGTRSAILLGTLLLALGYGSLILGRPAMLWAGLALLVAGHGLFKPGLQAAVGSLYSKSDPERRDSGFLLLHFVLNVGAMLAPAVAEWARARGGWNAVFYVATLAMLAGAISCALSRSGLQAPRRSAPPQASRVLDSRLQHERTRACWLVCGLGVVFWVAAVQATTSLTLFAAQNTETQLVVMGRLLTIAPGHFISLHSLLVLVLTPPLGWLFARLRRHGSEVSTPAKMIWGFVVTSAAFAVMGLAGLRGGDSMRVSMSWMVGCYVLLTLGELLLVPMGMALVTRLAPPEQTSRMVALWFASTAAGNGLAGALGLLWMRWPHSRYFAFLAALALGAAALLLARLRRVEQLLTAEQATSTPE